MDQKQLTDWAQGLGQDGYTWLGLSAIVIIWFIWGLAKKIVRLGYFVIAFAIGAALASAVAVASGHQVRPEGILASGLAFAFIWTTIRAKVARVVTSLAVGSMLSLGAHQGWDKLFEFGQKPLEKPAKVTPKAGAKKPASTKAATKKPASSKPAQQKPTQSKKSQPVNP